MRRLGLYPFEWIALGFAVLVFTFLALLRLPVSPVSVRYYVQAGLGVLPQAALAGFVLGGLHHLWQHREWRRFARQWVQLSFWALWLRLWLACLLVSFAYFWLKLYVPLINPSSWDQGLWALDRLVHLGVRPNEALTEAITHPTLLERLDQWYAKWLNTVLLFISFMAASVDAQRRRRFVLSCVLLWALGAVGYVLLPAVGPIYMFDEVWAPLADVLPRAQREQQNLWENYRQVLASAAGSPQAVDFRYGVAALPSLHVGFHVLFCIWAWRHVRVLFVPFVLLTVLTQVGAVVTGWHYAVDGYVGGLLAAGCYVLAVWLEPDAQADGSDPVSADPEPDGT